MFTWLKKLFGSDVPDTPVIAQEPVKEAPKATVGKVAEVESDIPAKPKAKKTTTKKGPGKKAAPKSTSSGDLEKMSKNDLLAHAKANGVKANASMKKADILAAIKNG